MDHTRVLKRAWHLVKGYRALWVFGLILALTTFSWETAVFWGRDNNDEANRQGIVVTREPGESFLEAFQRTIREEIDEANEGLEEFFARELHVEIESDILAIIAVLVGLMLIGYVIAKIVGYVGYTALIRMVDETEDSGVRHSVRQGFRMGWSRAAWRLFLIDVLVGIAAVSALILLFALLLAPLALWTTGSTPAGVIGTIITVGLFFPGLALVIVAGAALSMLKRFFRRACALEGLGVTESIRRGYAVARQHLREVAPVWLVTVGLELAWPFLMIPAVIVLAGVGVVLGGASALLMGGLAGLAFDGATPWVVAGAVGIPIFILTLAAPLAFLGGLREVFLSSTWTLTYRELQTLESAEPGQLPDLDTSGLKAAPVA
jgi:hypothetical protein